MGAVNCRQMIVQNHANILKICKQYNKATQKYPQSIVIVCGFELAQAKTANTVSVS